MFPAAFMWVGRQLAVPLSKRVVRRYIGTLEEGEPLSMYAARRMVDTVVGVWTAPLQVLIPATGLSTLITVVMTFAISGWIAVLAVALLVLWVVLATVKRSIEWAKTISADVVGYVIEDLIEMGDTPTGDRVSYATTKIENVLRRVT